VSLLSASGVPIEFLADIMGHTTTRPTAAIYRHNVLPTAEGAHQAMDNMFDGVPRSIYAPISSFAVSSSS
jgi:hypothetical protein